MRGIHGELQKKAVGVQSTEFSEVAVLRTSCSQKVVCRGASFPFECSTVRETATESRPQRRSATRRVYSTDTVVSSWKTGCFSTTYQINSASGQAVVNRKEDRPANRESQPITRTVPAAKPWSTERKIAPRTVNRDQSQAPGTPGTTHSGTNDTIEWRTAPKSALGTTYTSYTSSTAGTKPLVRSYDGMLVNILFSH